MTGRTPATAPRAGGGTGPTAPPGVGNAYPALQLYAPGHLGKGRGEFTPMKTHLSTLCSRGRVEIAGRCAAGVGTRQSPRSAGPGCVAPRASPAPATPPFPGYLHLISPFFSCTRTCFDRVPLRRLSTLRPSGPVRAARHEPSATIHHADDHGAGERLARRAHARC